MEGGRTGLVVSGHLGVVVGIEVGWRIIVEEDVLCREVVALIGG